MPSGIAIEQASAWAKNTPPPAESWTPPQQESIAPLLAETLKPGEVIDEREALRRFAKAVKGFREDPSTIINGTFSSVAWLVDLGFWRWADYKAGLLERRSVRPRPIVSSVYVPPSAQRTLRSDVDRLRAEVAALRERKV